jgi:pimeloyl-ACP methyl ester carboxylesterase
MLQLKLTCKLIFLQQLHCELPDAILRQIPDCGHIPHLERPDSTVKLIVEFIKTEKKKLSRRVPQVSQVSS